MGTGSAARPDPRTRLVDICLALPEAQASGDQHVRFHVRNKTFGHFLDDHHGDGRVALCCKVPTGDLDPLVTLDPERFSCPSTSARRVGLASDSICMTSSGTRFAKFVRVSYRLIAPKRLSALAR